MSDSFDFSDLINDSSYSHNRSRKKKRHNKTITTSDFILVLLFLFLAVVIGISVQTRYGIYNCGLERSGISKALSMCSY